MIYIKENNNEILSFDDFETEKKKLEEQKRKEEKIKEIEHKKELTKSVKNMQNKIKETNDILFSLLKISIFFLISVILIIVIKRAMG